MILDTSKVLAGGHRWARCSGCGLAAIVKDEGGGCRQTPRCKGRMAYGVARARGEVVRCARQGCGNVGELTTAIGEQVCSRCLAELADAQEPPA